MLKLFSVSSKLVLTAVMALVLLVGGLIFFPGLLHGLLDASKWLTARLPAANDLPVDNEGGKLLYDLVVNEQAIFGLMLTLVARILVELGFGLGEAAFGSGDKGKGKGGGKDHGGEDGPRGMHTSRTEDSHFSN
jgi:hypothetical protein